MSSQLRTGMTKGRSSLAGRREIAGFLVAYVVYTAARWLFVGDATVARANAETIASRSSPCSRSRRPVWPTPA